MNKNTYINSIYNYYQNHSTPGIKITKADLKKFPSKILARGHFAIVNHGVCPKILNILIQKKQEKLGKKPLIDCLISYYYLHPTPNIEITEPDLIPKDIGELRRAANSVLNDKFPWLLIEIINHKKKQVKKSAKGQLSIF